MVFAEAYTAVSKLVERFDRVFLAIGSRPANRTGRGMRRSGRPGESGRPGRSSQNERGQEDLRDAATMTEARVDLAMRHAHDRTRTVSAWERGGLPSGDV